MSCQDCPHCRAIEAAAGIYYPSPDEIIDAVCARFRVSRIQLFGACHDQALAVSRHVCMYLMRALTRLSYPAIGVIFHRDHSTVIFAYNKIAAQMIRRPAFGREMEKLIAELTKPKEAKAA